MSCSPSSRTIVCKEVFDENSVPSEEEVKDYAVKIGINPESEPHLLHFARDGLMQALPSGWKPCFDEELQSWYYFNFRSGESRWEHPLDDVYRNLVRKVRSESISSAGEEDSKTSAKEDLKSYEEAAPPMPENMQPVPRTLESIKGGGALKKGHIQLAPLKKSPVLSPLATPSSASPKKLQPSPLSSPAGSRSPIAVMENSRLMRHRDTSSATSETGTRSEQREPRLINTRIELSGGSSREPMVQNDILSPSARIDIDKMDMGVLVKKSEESAISRKEKLLSAQEKHPRGMTGRGELTLTGGGSMFLKSRQKSQESPTATASSPSPGVGVSPTSDVFGAVVEVVSSKDQDENLPKGILRGDQQRSAGAGKPLWDIDPREMSSEEKQMWRRQELEEERKSVRFNLEQELDIRFNLSDMSDQEEDGEEEEEEVEEEEGEDWNSDEEDPDEERVIAGMKVTDVLNMVDSSDMEEISDKKKALSPIQIVRQNSPESRRQQSLDSPSRPSSGMSKPILRPGARSVNGTRFTVERVHEPEMDGTSLLISSSKMHSEASSLWKHPELALEPFEKTDMQHTSSLVSNVTPSSEDLLGPIPSSPSPGFDQKQEKDDNLSEKNGEVDTKDSGVRDVNDSGEEPDVESSKHLDSTQDKLVIDEASAINEHHVISDGNSKLKDETVENEREAYQERLKEEIKKLEEENEKALHRHRELLAKRLEESIQKLENEQQERLDTLRTQLAKKEEEDETRLRTEVMERLASIESDLKTQKEIQEKTIRENMEASLQELRDTLAAEREAQIQALQREQEEIQALQVAEFKKKVEDDRIRLEQETADQIDKLEQELTKKLEEEHVRLEKSHTDQIEELTRLNKVQIESTKTRLEEELATHKEEMQQVHLKEVEAIDIQLKETIDQEKQAKLSELDEAKRRSESFEKLKREMEQELEQKRQELTAEHEAIVIELKAENAVRIEKLKLDFRMEEEQVRREHIERLDELRSRLSRELEAERQRLVKANDQQNDSTRQELAESSRVFEKLRCEKRLLEDKYRSLKEKYIRLKTDVKISMERRKRREAGGTTTGSETERSTSHKTGAAGGASADAKGRQQANDGGGSGSSTEKQRSSRRRTATNEAMPSDSIKAAATDSSTGNNKSGSSNSPKHWQGSAKPASELQSKRGEDSVDSDNISSSVSLQQTKGNKHSDTSDAHNTNNNRRRRQLFGRLKSASTSRLLLNNNNNSNSSNSNSNGQEEAGNSQGEDTSCSPVENLRRQLQKLEDLEDQFPASTHTDTYLRYPFTADSGQLGSSELEFFRHRIHLERDSVRRAKDFLRAQRNSFQSRQRELKQRQLDGSTTARNMLDQLYQEERELTDMEVSLHRTRSLLGEKIIRLRHLEQSLHRATSPRPKGHDKHEPREDATLSDLSSHSGSSGFSSTELGTDSQLGKLNAHRPVGGSSACNSGHYQESTEIIQSLENLNTEIREIWEVLNKQQKDGSTRQVVPPPSLVYPDMGWPMMLGPRAAAATAIGPSLPERMQVLRQQAQQNLSTMGQFTPSTMTAPQNASSQFTVGLGWSLQGQNSAAQLTQLGAALGHPSGATQFGGTVIGTAPGVGPTITDPSLVERTRSLRDWLRQARIDSADLISPGQATL